LTPLKLGNCCGKWLGRQELNGNLMTFDSAIEELFERIPALRAAYRTQCGSKTNATPSASDVFGSVLVPALESALERRDLGTMLRICAFLEDAAESAASDRRLKDLIQTEFGEWLGAAGHEDLSPWLGAETKRICGYGPGQAMQRKSLKLGQERDGWSRRVAGIFRKLTGR
jgi:hypothetical protein